jgi:transmembrane sensor
MEKLSVPQGITQEEAWLKLSDRLVQAEKSKLTFRKNKALSFFPGKASLSTVRTISLTQRLISGIAAAASIAILITAAYLLRNELSNTVIETSYGERISFQLPDGSNVTLNSGSKLTYNSSVWKNKRQTELEGEAYFEVIKGSSFNVITENAETRVLGTSFNVFSRNNELKVICYTGSVEVHTAAGDYAVLTKGDYLHGLKDKITELKHDAPAVNSWVNGEFYFHNEALVNVFAEMERQFNVRIEYSGNKMRSYSGYFNDSSISSALDLVCIPMGLNYKISNNRIFIY